MKSNISTMSILAILLVICCFAGFALTAEEEMGETTAATSAIIIRTSEEVRPATVSVSPGTTVIWVNHSRAPQEILFVDKKVTLVCAAPVNFFVNKDGVYESGKIPFGGTASLCFTEKGKYEYKAKSSRTFYRDPVKETRGFVWIK